MDEQELRPKRKRTRKRRSRAERDAAPMVDAGLPAEPTPTPLAAGEEDLGLPLQWALFDTGAAELVPALASDADAEPPIPAVTPLEPVGRSWSIRLGLLRREFTAETPGPRRMLLRDSSGMLVVLALLVLTASQLPPSPAADGGGGAVPSGSGGGVLLPGGTLDLFSATPEPTLAPGETPRPTFDVTHATLPPWCANLTCTVFVTPSPSPTPVPKSTAAATATPHPKPTPVPTATPKPTASPTPTPAPPPAPVITSGPAGGDTTATFLFEDADRHVTFACKLDTGGYKPCSSGITYTVIAGSGKHTFTVRAGDAAGNTSGWTPRSWRV
jgi:hypothetical protein